MLMLAGQWLKTRAEMRLSTEQKGTEFKKVLSGP